VHSLKDVPTDRHDDIVIAGVPQRGEVTDVLITPTGKNLDALPDGAVIGTASQRRKSQLLHARPELVVEPIRGNVDTRIEKLLAPWVQEARAERMESPDAFDEGIEEWLESLSPLERAALDRSVAQEYDGIVLARVGLVRGEFLGEVECVELSEPGFIPAPGQGALAVTARRGSDVASSIRQIVDHPLSRVETSVERIILDEIGGGCIAPIGIHATVRGENVHVAVAVFDQEGTERVGGTRELPIREYGRAASQYGKALCEEGAARLVAEARAAEAGGTVSRADE
jgi:hydroxymethylbilane synthase